MESDVEKQGPSHGAGGTVTWCSYSGKEFGGSSKVNHRVIRWPCDSTPRDMPPGIENWCANQNLHTNVHSSILCNSQRQKQSICSSADEWVDKLMQSHGGILCSH